MFKKLVKQADKITKGIDKDVSRALGAPEGVKVFSGWNSNDPEKVERHKDFLKGNNPEQTQQPAATTSQAPASTTPISSTVDVPAIVAAANAEAEKRSAETMKEISQLEKQAAEGRALRKRLKDSTQPAEQVSQSSSTSQVPATQNQNTSVEIKTMPTKPLVTPTTQVPKQESSVIKPLTSAAQSSSTRHTSTIQNQNMNVATKPVEVKASIQQAVAPVTNSISGSNNNNSMQEQAQSIKNNLGTVANIQNITNKVQELQNTSAKTEKVKDQANTQQATSTVAIPASATQTNETKTSELKQITPVTQNNSAQISITQNTEKKITSENIVSDTNKQQGLTPGSGQNEITKASAQDDQSQELLQSIKAMIVEKASAIEKFELVSSIYESKNFIELIKCIKDIPDVATEELLKSIKTTLIQQTANTLHLYSITKLDNFEKLLSFLESNSTDATDSSNSNSSSSDTNESIKENSAIITTANAQNNNAETEKSEDKTNPKQTNTAQVVQDQDSKTFELKQSTPNLTQDGFAQNNISNTNKQQTSTTISQSGQTELTKTSVAQDDQNEELLQSIKAVMIQDAADGNLLHLISLISEVQNLAQLSEVIKDNPVLSDYSSVIDEAKTTEDKSSLSSTDTTTSTNSTQETVVEKFSAADDKMVSSITQSSAPSQTSSPLISNNNNVVSSSVLNQANNFSILDHDFTRIKNLLTKNVPNEHLKAQILASKDLVELKIAVSKDTVLISRATDMLAVMEIDFEDINIMDTAFEANSDHNTQDQQPTTTHSVMNVGNVIDLTFTDADIDVGTAGSTHISTDHHEGAM